MKSFNVGFEDHGVGLAHHFAGGIYAKETRIPAGLRLSQHKHSFSHLSILAVGSVIVRSDGHEDRYNAPAAITIAAGREHEVEALTDTVWFCVHTTSETDAEKIDHELVA